jgi:hypothetical protein
MGELSELLTMGFAQFFVPGTLKNIQPKENYRNYASVFYETILPFNIHMKSFQNTLGFLKDCGSTMI